MMTYDTLKIGFDGQGIRGLDKLCFDEVTRKRTDELTGERVVDSYLDLRKEYKPVGLSSVRVWTDGTAQVEGSAKALRADYLKGVSENTFEQWVEGLSNKAVEFDATGIEESGKVYRSDPCINVRPVRPLGDYFSAVDFYPIQGYSNRNYDKDGRALSCLKKSPELKDRLIMYDKGLELKNFQYVDKRKVEGVLRIEANVRNFEQARRLYNLSMPGQPPLKAILQTTANPLLKIYDNVFTMKDIENTQKVFGFYEDYEGKPFYVFERDYGRSKIIQDFNFDIKLIRGFIKSRVKGDISRYVRAYKELIGKLKVQQDNDGYMRTIQELREMLKTA